MTLKKLDLLLFFDGISIFFIVLYHELYILSYNPFFFLCPYLIFLGLSLFTLSAGYKLSLNHFNELNQKKFLSEYFIKRFIRLYKPYLGYSLLILFPILLITYISVYFFNINYTGINFFLNLFNNINIFYFIGFFLGYNVIAIQLWYLVALIAITSICFTILYFLNIKWLFFFFIPSLLISLLIKIDAIKFEFVLVNNVFIYLPFFIFGICWSCNQYYQKCKWFQQSQFYFPILFLIDTVSIIILQNFIDITILQYFCGFFFPFFLTAIFESMKKTKLLFGFLMYCGSYSFQIFLFHAPLILQIISRFILDIMKINNIFIPIVISVLTIYFCVIAYKFTKKIHLNRLFE